MRVTKPRVAHPVPSERRPGPYRNQAADNEYNECEVNNENGVGEDVCRPSAFLARPLRVGDPFAPRPGEEPAAGQAGYFHCQQVMAGGDAGAAVVHHS